MSEGVFFPVMMAVAAVAGALVVAAEILAVAPSPAARRLCDQQVATLLTSHDPVEVQRAGILVHEIPCDIARRLPAHAS